MRKIGGVKCLWPGVGLVHGLGVVGGQGGHGYCENGELGFCNFYDIFYNKMLEKY